MSDVLLAQEKKHEHSVYSVEKDDRPEDTTIDRKSNLKVREVEKACQGIDSL